MQWVPIVLSIVLSIHVPFILAAGSGRGFQTKIIGDWKQDICLNDKSNSDLLTVDFGSNSASDIIIDDIEVRPLVIAGPSANRVDFVFFSDGYLASERDKFFADAQRLVDDIVHNQTFSVLAPIMNLWGVFTASNESGIGVGSRPKNTAFQLYRDGTELRGVFYTSAGQSAVEHVCGLLEMGCDIRVIIGNDPYYGGVAGSIDAGNIATVTASPLNGPIVLRHELGHTIFLVGEEYDGGEAYYGENNVKSTDSERWKHWLTDPSNTRAERVVMPVHGYVWTLLNTTLHWSTNFTSTGTFSRHLLKFSLSGLPRSGDLKIELDGVDLEWQAEPRVGMDRWNYDIHRSFALTAGTHELKFTLLNKTLEGSAQLAYVEILEYGDESEFNDSPGYVGFYPTFSSSNQTSYRATNENCLMRNMTHPTFCSICKERLWLVLFAGLNVTESVAESCSAEGKKVLEVKLLPFAQFRETPIAGEVYTVVWKWDGQVLSDFANLTQVEITSQVTGTYTVEAQFHTDEVRTEENWDLIGSIDYAVSNACS
ncbi:IgA peptidase M64-domain-containing protein [Coprinopsis sp. MPI-PUGE-AT-0042]|nr:IgA peptidase M64-domain-containing protein [Coprinopsis sp. MPI-PUGE-AT-0042]